MLGQMTGSRLKRGASDTDHSLSEEHERGKRLRYDEGPSVKSTSLSALESSSTFLVRSAFDAVSTSYPSPVGFDGTSSNPFSSPAAHRTSEDYSGGTSTPLQQQHLHLQGYQPQPSPQPFHSQASAGWGPTASHPGCSDISEQTMEDVQYTPMQAPQTSTAEQTPYWSMQPPQRSNSLPDLRVLINGPINTIPPAVFGTQSHSSSTASALVPYKAPTEVVQDAHQYILRQRLAHAIMDYQRRELDTIPAAPESLMEDPMESEDVEEMQC